MPSIEALPNEGLSGKVARPSISPGSIPAFAQALPIASSVRSPSDLDDRRSTLE